MSKLQKAFTKTDDTKRNTHERDTKTNNLIIKPNNKLFIAFCFSSPLPLNDSVILIKQSSAVAVYISSDFHFPSSLEYDRQRELEEVYLIKYFLSLKLRLIDEISSPPYSWLKAYV